MLRLPSQQALRAVCNPLRNPLRNRLSNPLCHPPQTRHVHNGQAPFSGPPSYATITRRFSLTPNPLGFVTEKRADEAKDRGEFIDIHDAHGVMPKDYDVLLIDVTASILRDEVAEIVGIPYLKKATKDEANKKINIGTGFVYGDNNRLMFLCVVGLEGRDRSYWAFFIVDPGSPHTYISPEIADALGITKGPTPVTIAGYRHYVNLSPKNSHFADISLLGSDYIVGNNLAIGPYNIERKVDLVFGWGKWELKPKL